MRNIINIKGNDQTFKYILEYTNNADKSEVQHVSWVSDSDIIYLLKDDTKYYRVKNDWYNTDKLNTRNTSYIPKDIDLSNIRIYIPEHSVDTYIKNAKYALTANTWINGKNVNLGTLIFKSVDTLAAGNAIKDGNNTYYEYVDMEIIDPYDIMYADNWELFRKNICNEPKNINNTGALLNVSLYIVEESEERFIIKDHWIGGYTTFNICNESTEYMKLNLSKNLDPLGWNFDLTINSQYDWLITYLNETYGINNISHNDIEYEIVLKSKEAIIPGPIVKYVGFHQVMTWEHIKQYNIPERKGFYDVFRSWNNFEEGWFVVGSLTVYDKGEEILSIVSNEVPLTQDVFKYFVESINIPKKIIDPNNPNDMEIINYNVVNKKIENIVQIERPDNSKSNIIQPVFFKVKDTEKLTLHPAVTENICINLDDYKSKVKSFKLQIEDCVFNQIGSNNYGIIFKVTGSSLPNIIKEGTYYILNENSILVTTGKYKYVI